MSVFAFTCGDINGIGLEIIIKSLNKIKFNRDSIFVLAPHKAFLENQKLVSAKFPFIFVNKIPKNIESGKVYILNIGQANSNFGKITSKAGSISFKAIISACKLSSEKVIDAIITAPISKESLHKAGVIFPGHTELLADYFNIKKFAMMFLSKNLKAVLSSIHIPLKEVPDAINKKLLIKIINVTLNSLKNDFGILKPKIAILGLNPHAGENGQIGNEENEIISPILKNFKNKIFGPFVPDAFFGKKEFLNYDCTIGMYHDQILIPFKLLNFNSGVNFTAGLPIVRTSPDHGTAFDIAGKGIADPGSMIEAFNYAKLIVNNRKKLI